MKTVSLVWASLLRSCYGYKWKKKALESLRSEYTSDVVSPDGKTRGEEKDAVASNNFECLIMTSQQEEVLTHQSDVSH